MKHFLIVVSLVLTGALSAQVQPNIVFILVDDMGYGDLPAYGAPDVKTPHLDALASQGVRFTQFYANGPECTPSRTAILTGRYPQRVGGLECAIGTGNVGRYDDAIALAENSDLGLPPEYAVLAPGLSKLGYRTAVFGKWHLGYENKFSPLDQGFDEFRGFLGGNVDYFHHIELSDIPVCLDGREVIKREGYMTHLITQDSLEFLDRQSSETPFFLYVPYGAPHFPFQGPDDLSPEPVSAEQWTAGTRETYVEMLEDMDANVGQIMEKLDTMDFASNTLIVFASDHGAIKPGINTPLRDFKSTLFEGGIRVPCIVRWPGQLHPGTVSDRVGCLMDLTTSFLQAAGVETVGHLDGVDILMQERAERPNLPRSLYWRSKRGDRTWRAVRHHNWKMVWKEEGGAIENWLFDLAKDPTESVPLDDESTKARLTAQLQSWEAEVVSARP
ncbi:MAG: sulfatase-like hydrolase/transferase [Verrucomicrobiota bacterium]